MRFSTSQGWRETADIEHVYVSPSNQQPNTRNTFVCLTCHRCDGGKLEVVYPRPSRHDPLEQASAIVDCPDCGGSGMLDIEVAHLKPYEESHSQDNLLAAILRENIRNFAGYRIKP